MFGKIFSKVNLDSVNNIVDNLVTNKEERKELKIKFKQVLLDAESKAQAEVTKRHTNDMQSDSWLSKNIRPLLTIFSLALYTLFAILDGNVGEFNIANQYVDLLGQIVIMSLGFYFTSRGVEKTAKILKK